MYSCRCARLMFHPSEVQWVFMSRVDHTGESVNFFRDGGLWFSGKNADVFEVTEDRDGFLRRFVLSTLVTEVMES